MIAALSSMSPQIPAPSPTAIYQQEWTISKRSLPNEFAQHVHEPPEKLNFSTVGGVKQGTDVIGLKGEISRGECPSPFEGLPSCIKLRPSGILE